MSLSVSLKVIKEFNHKLSLASSCFSAFEVMRRFVFVLIETRAVRAASGLSPPFCLHVLKKNKKNQLQLLMKSARQIKRNTIWSEVSFSGAGNISAERF